MSSSVGMEGHTAITNVTLVLFTLYRQQSFVSVFEMAVEEVNKLYGDVVRFEVVPLSRPEITSCVGVTNNVVDLATEYYYRKLPSQNSLMTVAPSKSFYTAKLNAYDYFLQQWVLVCDTAI